MSSEDKDIQPPDEGTEAALRASKQWFRTMTDAAPQLIWTNVANGWTD
jgi:hypothetical protein